MLSGNVAAVFEHMARVGPLLALALLALSLANYVLRALRWHAFARGLHLAVPFRRNLLYYFAGFGLLLTPAKLGEAVRLWLLRHAHGARYERSLALMVSDRLSDGFAMVVLLAASAGAFAGHAHLVVLAAAVVLLPAFLLAKPRLLIALVGRLYGAVHRAPRWFARARTFLRKTAQIATPRLLLATIGLSIAGWLAEVWAFHLLLAHLGANVPFLHAMFIFGLAAIVGGLIVVPGGLGGTEATMLLLLNSIGVDPGVAIAATLLIRATTLWFAVLLGLVALPFAIRKVRR